MRIIVTQNELLKMSAKEREDYLLVVLQRKLTELKNSAAHSEATEEQHHHGPEFQRGMTAGFVSGLGFAARLLSTEKEITVKIMEQLNDYNIWAQSFNRQSRGNNQQK
ncbi:hypothetical protein Dred_2801 [Desulforamulus reducens MI-1]|uniref:Uncharacterized protein n=2 Tax=Desulforamulus TaxID=2916693 RepID=A4J8A2_DESRM|nr:hypothetical protein Dred_2801 [Desulforamulus reducens MI-1]